MCYTSFTRWYCGKQGGRPSCCKERFEIIYSKSGSQAFLDITPHAYTKLWIPPPPVQGSHIHSVDTKLSFNNKTMNILGITLYCLLLWKYKTDDMYIRPRLLVMFVVYTIFVLFFYLRLVFCVLIYNTAEER